MAEQLYRIHWRSERTRFTGHGTGSFPYAQALQIVDQLNHEDKYLIIHWVEPVQNDEAEAEAHNG